MLRIGEQLCLASSRFGKLNLGSTYCAFSCLQAGAFAYQRMNPHAQRTVEKMLPLMVIFNSIGLFWASGRALNSLSEKYGISFYSERLMQGGWNAPDWSTPKIFFYNVAMTLLATCGATITAACIIGPRGDQYQKHAIELFAVCQTALFFFHTSASSILTMAAQAMTAYSSLLTNTRYDGNGKEVALNSMAVLGALQLALSMLQNRHSFPAKTVFNSQMGLAFPLLIYRSGLTVVDLDDNNDERVRILIKNLCIPAGVFLAFVLANSSGNGGNNNTIPTLKKDFGTLTLNPYLIHPADTILRSLVSSEILINLHIAPHEEEDTNRKLCFLIAAIKALTLYQINQINWVHIKRTFIKPLENQAVQFYDSFGRLFSERMSSFLKSSAQEISIEQWVILPADVNLAEGLESLYESMENLFEGSAWKTNHRLFLHQYLVSLKKIPQMLGNLDITQYITRTTGKIYEKGYGWGILWF